MPASPVKCFTATRHDDARGWFMETYSAARMREQGVDQAFVQDNHSCSRDAFTLRGLHFQVPPMGQDKLVRCVRGRIFDVAVDLRANSPTYGRWIGTELSERNAQQLFIPVGFAHAFLTLEPDCEVIYKCSAPYDPGREGGIVWNDPDLAIAWPLPLGSEPVVSDKDARQTRLIDFASPFEYDGRPLAPL